MQRLIKIWIPLLAFIAPLCVAIERPIVVIIPSYNNSAWYQRNIDSVINQKYSNYRVVYINDCSTDGTGELVAQYVAKFGAQHLITIINNSARVGALANLYRAIHMLPDKAIVLTLDGDDYLAHDGVLSRINQAYDLGVWLTYGQFKTYPQDAIGFCREMPQGIISNNFYREYEWITSHPRTFYAGLFKKIPLKDLLYEGAFFDVTWDMAFMYPMLEMAAGCIAFIPEVLYVYNQDNTLNDFRIKTARQIRCKYYIASKNKYTRAASCYDEARHTVGMIIISDANPRYLATCLASIDYYALGIEDITVLYSCQEDLVPAYQEIQAAYNTVLFKRKMGDRNLQNLIYEQKHPYVFITDDSVALSAPCDISVCAQALRKSHGHAFYLEFGADQAGSEVSLLSLNDDIKTWQFKYGSHDFKKPFTMHMALYSKETVKTFMQRMPFCNDLCALNELNFDHEHVGLCFDHTKVKRIR